MPSNNYDYESQIEAEIPEHELGDHLVSDEVSDLELGMMFLYPDEQILEQ